MHVTSSHPWVMGTPRVQSLNTTYHMLLNLITKPLDVLRRSIPQRLSKIPPRPQTQLALALISTSTLTLTLTPKRTQPLALNRLLNTLHARLNQRPRPLAPLPPGTRLEEPRGKHVPARGARGHLKLEVARPVDELEHGVRRVVPRTASELVYARVAARTPRVARREGLEELGRERRFEQEGGGPFPGWVRAFLPQRDDLGKHCA